MNSVLEGRPALKKEVEKIAEVAGYLWQNGWAERNGGNITVNVTDLVDDETKAFCPLGLGIVPYQLPGSLKLAEETLKELEDYDVVMWEKHGVFAKGLDVMDAFDQIDVLSKSAKIYIDSKCMGFEPDGMSQEEMAEMTKAFNLPR